MAVTVLIVDDSAFFRKRLSEILHSVTQIDVIGTANNGKEAIEQAKRLKLHNWFHGVMVSTQDFESCDPSSSLGGT